jgi:hypothetical protein
MTTMCPPESGGSRNDQVVRGPRPPDDLCRYAALLRRTPPPSVSMTLFRSLTQA